MKVLFVSEYWSPRVMGGGEISGGLLAGSLAAKGVDVSVLTSNFPGLAGSETVEGVKVFRRLSTGANPQSPLSNLRRAALFTRSVEKELPKLDREECFDIIHSLNITSLIGVSKFRRKAKKPCVAHINSPTPFCPRGLLLKGDRECDQGSCDYASFKRCMGSFGSVSRMDTPFYLKHNPVFRRMVYRNYKRKNDALKAFDCCIPISSFIKKMLLADGIPAEKIEVIPNIVETERFFDLPATGNAVPRILYLGPYSGYKGPQVLLSALPGLAGEYACDFYGKGPLREDLIKYAREKNLKNVSVNGEVPQARVQELYATHDIVVFPSLVAEAFGRVPVEAMASGRPVIASELGGVTDIIDEGKTGLFFKAGDAAGLREALKRLLSDAPMRERMGWEGRRVVAERYTTDAVTRRVIGVYERLAGASG